MKDGTKAEVLRYLAGTSIHDHILPVCVVESERYFSNIDQETEKVIRFANENKLIVRSSARNEDTAEFSNAGKYESILNVEPDPEHVKQAIEKVYSSYETLQNEEILIQPMLEQVIRSGVVFTADTDTFAEYNIVNFSDSNNTAAITAGTGDHIQTFISYKNKSIKILDEDISRLIKLCGEIENILDNHALDIEFAITKAHLLYILQVRPIAKGRKEDRESLNLDTVLNRIYRKVEKLSRRHPFLLGETTYFGVMPDWNPAEILGIRPRKLTISLYKELVTDSIWAHQRNNYGYRDLTMHPLMISFCGVPYIDTRITFNSFIPGKLNEKIAEKLVNYYLLQLKNYPKYHDKIEFEIVFSCYYIGIGEKLKKLLNFGFNENEIKRIEYSLLDLTNEIIDPHKGLYKNDIRQIDILEKHYDRITKSDISLVDKIYWLIEECKEYGTLPFAGVARAAFIAIQFLKSFLESGIISETEYDGFMNSLSTINRKMSGDLQKYYSGQISKKDFLDTYGHIRPGTYDILSEPYSKNFEAYFDGYSSDLTDSNKFAFSRITRDRMDRELEENGILVTAEEMIGFMKEAIEKREYLKFIFTKSVNQILLLIEELGKRTGISKDDMSYLDISVVKQLYTDLYSGDVAGIFRRNIDENKHQQKYALQIKLPSVITSPENIYQYYLLREEPNFITQRSVYAKTLIINSDDREYERKIIFIQSADPGYDFLFSKNIAGLITQFGGANSHMAIRCAELGIPAVIGAGEQNYNKWKNYRYIFLDCMKKQVISVGGL